MSEVSSPAALPSLYLPRGRQAPRRRSLREWAVIFLIDSTSGNLFLPVLIFESDTGLSSVCLS